MSWLAVILTAEAADEHTLPGRVGGAGAHACERAIDEIRAHLVLEHLDTGCQAAFAAGATTIPPDRALLSYLTLVPGALVPAAHVTPFAFQYMGRSTTTCAGVAPMLSTIAAKRRCDPAGNAAAKSAGG